MDLKLELIVLPVSDVDRAKAFYESAGFRLDLDKAANEQWRAVHLTPPGSEASIMFGKDSPPPLRAPSRASTSSCPTSSRPARSWSPAGSP
ncbi:VOC family protein [Catellatospora coxensis]